MILKSIPLGVLLLLFSCLPEQISSAPIEKKEQSHFSAEDSALQNARPLPKGILDQLREDKLVKNVSEFEHVPSEQLPRSWFSASVIRLGSQEEPDWIIRGEPPLAGGNTAPFWIFRSLDDRFELVLFASAHDLEIKKTRHRGFRDVVISGPTSNKVYSTELRFDGKKYSAARD